MKTTKTIKQIEEITYECEVCSRISTLKSVIEQCEKNHKICGSNHDFWTNQHRSQDEYKTVISLLAESNSQVMIVNIKHEGFDEKYAIVSPQNQGYWILALYTKKECVKLCKELGWEIVSCNI